MLTTDKKLYQPGQTIHIRALALRTMDLRPARRPIRIRVRDPKQNVVFSNDGKTSGFGVASLDFALAREINLGWYTVEASGDGAGKHARSSRRVQVKRYMLPKFKISIDSERRYYRPGEMLRGTVRSRYFFGKPVAGAAVSLEIFSRGQGAAYTTKYRPGQSLPDCSRSCGCLDQKGRCTFEVRLEKGRHPGTGEVRVIARITDKANQRQSADLSLPFTSRPLRLSVISENDRLVPGVRNRVHVVAGYPDGTAAVGASVELKAGRTRLTGRTDTLGVATFLLLPRTGHRRPGLNSGLSRGMPLAARATDRAGQRGARHKVLPLAARASVLVRPLRSVVGAGEVVQMTLLAGRAAVPVSGSRVFVDVVKGGQTLWTQSALLRRGRATVRFVPDSALFGLLELRGYRLSSSGRRVGTSRMVYVDHPGRLQIKARADRSVYRPGGRARITFEVSDSRTGDGVQAALGLLAVDEALVALGGLSRSSPKIFLPWRARSAADGCHWLRPGPEGAG